MAKEIAPAFQVYANDFLDLHVQLMLPDELGVYWRLLLFMWIEDGLPDDELILESLAFQASIGRLSGAATWAEAAGEQALNNCETPVHRPFNEIWEVVRERFYVDAEGLLRNKRQEEIRNGMKSRRKQCSDAGIESGKARRASKNTPGATVERPLKKRSTERVPPVSGPLNSSSSSSSSSSNRESAPAGASERRRTRFVPPTAAEAQVYAEQFFLDNPNLTNSGYQFVGATFCDFYTSKGWKVGAQVMTDWEKSCNGWIRRNVAKARADSDLAHGQKIHGRKTAEQYDESRRRAQGE